MKLTAAIIDDERLARARLSRMLNELNVSVIAQGRNGLEAVEIAREHKPDIIFLDINMPIKNGIDAANDIGEMGDEAPSIVFCTAYEQFAIEAFKTHASDYLVKPVQKSDIDRAVTKTLSVSRLQRQELISQGSTHRSVTINVDGITKNIDSGEIVYFSTVEKSVFAGLASGKQVIVDTTLKYIESEYADSFIRLHRSTLANIDRMEAIFKNDDGSISVMLEGCNEIFTVSRRHLKQVKECFQN